MLLYINDFILLCQNLFSMGYFDEIVDCGICNCLYDVQNDHLYDVVVVHYCVCYGPCDVCCSHLCHHDFGGNCLSVCNFLAWNYKQVSSGYVIGSQLVDVRCLCQCLTDLPYMMIMIMLGFTDLISNLEKWQLQAIMYPNLTKHPLHRQIYTYL